MKAYIYQAALYCEECGEAIRNQLDASFKENGCEPVNTADESSYDSDRYPKGPYENGGGEADKPQHCGACDAFLENPLTDDGVRYVEESLLFPSNASAEVLHTWRSFYEDVLSEDAFHA